MPPCAFLTHRIKLHSFPSTMMGILLKGLLATVMLCRWNGIAFTIASGRLGGSPKRPWVHCVDTRASIISTVNPEINQWHWFHTVRGGAFPVASSSSPSPPAPPGQSMFKTLRTTPVEGMKPGTSGLRKKVKVVRDGLYLHNFVQALFDSLPPHEKEGATMVVSGDGRHYNREAIQIIIEIAAANGVGRLWIGKGGIMSTPAVSAVIREREGGTAMGGIILTASHNPGGPEEDFGIKYNMQNGEPALESFTDAVYAATLSIEEIKILANAPKVDLDVLGVTRVGEMVVEVIDPVQDYLGVLKDAFDFEALRKFIARPGGFKLVFDAMHGVAAPYAQVVLGKELGCPPSTFLHASSKEDFGGLHPDPNLAYASDLVKVMGLLPSGAPDPSMVEDKDVPDLGAAADGDADRNMILGKRFFVTPSDSLALIAANADAIPFFREQGGLRTVARSMPTSQAVDQVARAKGLTCVETPTGWKYFGNLMDARALGSAQDYVPILCGEESFGTGSNHVREKDGMWAVLAWLSILASHNPNPEAPLKPISAIVQEHWAVYGRYGQGNEG